MKIDVEEVYKWDARKFVMWTEYFRRKNAIQSTAAATPNSGVPTANPDDTDATKSFKASPFFSKMKNTLD